MNNHKSSEIRKFIKNTLQEERIKNIQEIIVYL